MNDHPEAVRVSNGSAGLDDMLGGGLDIGPPLPEFRGVPTGIKPLMPSGEPDGT